MVWRILRLRGSESRRAVFNEVLLQGAFRDRMIPRPYAPIRPCRERESSDGEIAPTVSREKSQLDSFTTLSGIGSEAILDGIDAGDGTPNWMTIHS
jgi:hypothetical protein